MYLDRSKTTVHGKTYHRVLPRQSFRQDGKAKHRTVANLSACSDEEINAIALAFQHKKNLDSLHPPSPGPLHLRQGLCFGAVWVLHQLAQRTGLAAALGSDRQGTLALWQVIARALDQGSRLSAVRPACSAPARQGALAVWPVLARALDQGSRLSAVRLACAHPACDGLGLESFNEDQLYPNLAWLAQNQVQIEQ